MDKRTETLKQSLDDSASRPISDHFPVPTQRPHKKIAPIKFNSRSLWQEPEREDGLTLYERHRKPRPVVRGRVKCSLKALGQEFRCVICLGRINKTRMVVECLHRFCEECIERSIRVGRNQCPICRVVIPTRRSLVSDPDFDRLILCTMGQEEVKVAADHWAESKLNSNSESLQKAIFRKQTNAGPAPLSVPKNDDTGGNHDDGYDTKPKAVPADVLDVALFRDRDEVEIDQLLLPYLRLKKTVTIAVLKRFLQKKLELPNAPLQITFFPQPDYRAILPDSATLEEVRSVSTDSSPAMVQLYYRIGPN